MKRKLLLLSFFLLLVTAGMALLWRGSISFTTFLDNRDALIAFVTHNRLQAMAVFAAVYFTVALISLPVTLVLSVTGGALFGAMPGLLLVLMAAILGGSLSFMLSRTIFHDYFMQKAGRWLKKLHGTYHADAPAYLLLLRMTPVLPFSAVNMIAAVLGTPYRTFFWTTLLGAIPLNLCYALIGQGLDGVFAGEALRLAACRTTTSHTLCTAEISPASFFSLPMLASVAAIIGAVLISLLAKRFMARRQTMLQGKEQEA